MTRPNDATGPIPLKAANLGRLPDSVRVPSYDRGALARSIVHIGVGGFHRAHQAVYLDDLLHRPGHEEWGICGLGILPHDARIRDALAAQDYLYTVVIRGAGPDHARVIGSIADFVHAPDDPEAAIEALASAETRIVSLTITDRGYYLNPGTGRFDDQHPDVVHDLAQPGRPVATFGYLAEALDRRRARGLEPFTLLSCDNFQNNGDLARSMLLTFLGHRDPALAEWVGSRGAFPNSMVDRITPATTDEHRALVRDAFGIDDAWPVTTEPFSQWVIEDHFPLGRPPWEEVGAQMTRDVPLYERMKIRLLNGGHQVLCYIGLLLGYRYAPEAMADPDIERLLTRFMDREVTPLLPPVPGIDLEDYKRTLRERFANPAIKDQLGRLAADGSLRVSEFVAPTILAQLQAGGPIEVAAFTVAAWLRYLTGVDDLGRAMPFSDPTAEALKDDPIRADSDPRELLTAAGPFGEVLPNHPRFAAEVSRALHGLFTEGARATLARYAAGDDGP